MKKALKWAAFALLALLLIAAVTALHLAGTAKIRTAKKYGLQPAAVLAIPSDSASIAEGKKWADALCSGCHGADMAGTRFFDVPDLGLICAPNLTPGGTTKTYTDLDWDRAIRHGVNKDGKGLLIMPAKDFQYMSDEHTAQIIAYLKTLSAAEQNWPAVKTTFLCDILFQVGAFGDALNVETIDHTQPAPPAPRRAVSPEYGAYLVTLSGCRTCHGAQLNGGKDPNPEAPMGPNLTPGGSLPAWTADGFLKTMRTGITPYGKELNPKFMPWKNFGHLADDQIQAVYAYLMAQPKLETAVIKK